MQDRLKRAANKSLWGNLDESARIAREYGEAERAKRDAKTSRLKQLRLALAAQKPSERESS
jgi:hypothetical protein